MRNQSLRFSFENKDYFIQFAYKQDDQAWAESIAKNSKWTPKMLKAINEAVESIAESEGAGHLPPVEISDLETPPKLLHNNVTICEILRGNVGDSTKEMITWFKGKAYRAVMDNFEKEKGRQESLESALKDANAISGLLKENGIDFTEKGLTYEGGNALIARFRCAAWEAYNHRKEIHCAECGEIGVRTRWKIEDWMVNKDGETVTLKLYVPVRSCTKCGQEWTDQEASEIREAATKEFLKPQSALEKHLEKSDVPQV